MEFSNQQLKKARKKAGLSQEDVARKLGVSYVSYYKWERGDHAPGGKYIGALAEILGVRPDFFYPMPRQDRGRSVKAAKT